MGEHDPIAGAEAVVQAIRIGVDRVLAPALARSVEADVLDDVEGEQPPDNLLDEFRHQVGPVPPAGR